MELFKATITEKRKCASNVSTNIEDLPCKEFTAKNQQNQALSLKIYQGDKLIYFHMKEIGDIVDTLYKAESSLESFYNINRIFRQFLSTEELLSFYFQSYNEEEIGVLKKDKKIKLKF